LKQSVSFTETEIHTVYGTGASKEYTLLRRKKFLCSLVVGKSTPTARCVLNFASPGIVLEIPYIAKHGEKSKILFVRRKRIR
jgi:hypothetical protein